MLTIISAIFLSVLCVYFAHTVGRVFYGNIWDVLFFVVAVPLMFMQSRMRIINWVRKARTRYFKFWRILTLICAYFVLVICTSFIPVELRTASTLKYVKPAVEKVDDLKPVERLVVVSYGEKDATAIVVKMKSGQKSKYFVQLKKQGKAWVVADYEKVGQGRYTFPPYR